MTYRAKAGDLQLVDDLSLDESSADQAQAFDTGWTVRLLRGEEGAERRATEDYHGVYRESESCDCTKRKGLAPV